MEELLKFLNSLTRKEQMAFAGRCGTTIGYLRKAIYTDQCLGPALVIEIERESNRVVRCEALRPDVDWTYLRSSPAELVCLEKI